MKLIKDLYRIDSLIIDYTSINATITLNNSSDLYKGHFPDNPITPGVAQIYIFKDILNASMDKRFQLVKAKEIKFLRIHNPILFPKINVSIQIKSNYEHNILVNGIIYFEENIFLKLNGEYRSL